MTFITKKPPPSGRIEKHTGKFERHLYEAAVMLAIARWLFASGAKKGVFVPRWGACQAVRHLSLAGERGLRENCSNREQARGW